MNDFNGRGSFGGRGGFKKSKPGFKKFNERGRDDAPKQMHSARCSECGKSCEVPFRPSGDKPVFCNDCFNAQKESRSGNFAPRSNRGFDKSRFDRPTRDFAPTVRPVESKPDPRIGDIKKQLEDLSRKLDTLITLMQPKDEVTSESKPKTKKKVVAKKK